jgi:transcriptional regulator with XRE-family HTH domain
MEATEIKRRRIHLGFTQDDLATAFGVSRNTVSRWELGTAQPEAPGMLRMAFDYLLAERALQDHLSAAFGPTTELLSDLQKEFGLDNEGHLQNTKTFQRAIKRRLKSLQQAKLELTDLVEQNLRALEGDESLTKRHRVRKQKS